MWETAERIARQVVVLPVNLAAVNAISNGFMILFFGCWLSEIIEVVCPRAARIIRSNLLRTRVADTENLGGNDRREALHHFHDVILLGPVIVSSRGQRLAALQAVIKVLANGGARALASEVNGPRAFVSDQSFGVAPMNMYRFSFFHNRY